MKDINKLKNYREKYKRYYKIDFDNSYAIHHIDFNRKNNDIKNLLLLPKNLHHKYHYYLTKLFPFDWKQGSVNINIKIEQFAPLKYVNTQELLEFINILLECKKWISYKERLDFSKYLEVKND